METKQTHIAAAAARRVSFRSLYTAARQKVLKMWTSKTKAVVCDTEKRENGERPCVTFWSVAVWVGELEWRDVVSISPALSLGYVSSYTHASIGSFRPSISPRRRLNWIREECT